MEGQPFIGDPEPPPFVTAGLACTDLIAYPTQWINRRVETIELLSHEETRRRVSIDFTLSDDYLADLEVEDGIVVPISALTKEARRNFDLRDEAGRAIPVLGKEQNGALAHVALLGAALDALPQDPSEDAFEMLAADLRRIVSDPPPEANDALAFFVGSAEAGDPIRGAVWADATCQLLLTTLWANYVLFAVLQPGGANRRILKYGYGDQFTRVGLGFFRALRPRELVRHLRAPDRRDFLILTPGASRAASFHAEVAIPEELRVTSAFLYDFNVEEPIGLIEKDVDRASLYASEPIGPEQDVDAYVEVAPERGGTTFQGAITSVIVAALLWLGVDSGLDAKNPGAAVSLLLAGAALFSGFSAVRGEHRLVRHIFSASRRWLVLVTLSALAASASLAMEVPNAHPVNIWRGTAIVCSVAAARLIWSAIRAPA